MRKSFTRLSSLLVLLLLSLQMVLAVPTLITTGSGGLSPTDGGILNPNNPVFTMTFQANVQPGLLQIIGLYNSSGAETKAIQLRADQRTTTADSVYFTHPDGVVTFKGKVVKIKFTGVNWSALQNQLLWITVGHSAIQDASGNFSPTTAFDGGAQVDRWDFTVQDLTAPTVKALYPKDEAVNVPTAYGPFAMKFKETVRFVNGASYAPALGDFALYRSIDAAQPTPEEGGDLQSLLTPVIRCFSSGSLVPWGNSFDSLTITWFNPFLPDNTALYVRVKSGIIEDLSDNIYVGINNEEGWDFHTKDDRFIAPVITSQTHGGSCTDSIWDDGNFYATFESDEVLYYTSGTLIPNNADLKAFITITDQNGVNIPIRTAIFDKPNNKITIDPENVLVSSGLSFTVTFAANKIIDASGNLNKANSRKFVAGNWDPPTVITQRVTNQSGTTMDFLVKTNEPCAIHYIVVRKDPAFDPSQNEIFGHATYPGAATVVNNSTNDDKFYRIPWNYVATPAITPALAPDGNYRQYYGKQTAVDKWSMVEIFAEGNINVPQGNVEVLKRINGLPATHGITDSPAAYYEIWYTLVDTLCTQGSYASSYWAKNNSQWEQISDPKVMDGTSVYTTDILMPEAWFDADSVKVGGVSKLINKDKENPVAYGGIMGRIYKDGKIYINFNEPIRKFDGNEFSSVPATLNTELKSYLWVYENSGGVPGSDLNSDTGWSTNTNYTASLSADKKQIIITPVNSWNSGSHVWVKIRNSKIEDQRGNEIVPYNNLYTQEFRVEWYTPPLVRYTFNTGYKYADDDVNKNSWSTRFTPLDSLIEVPYKDNHNTTVAPITVTVSSKIYVFPGALLETGIVPAGELIPFSNDTTKLAYIGNFFKIRKGTGSTVTESFGEPLERKDFTFTIDYNYGDSTKIIITPKKQYDSEVWYLVQIDNRIQDQSERTILQGASTDNDSWRPKMFKLANALTGNAVLPGWVRASSATDDNQTAVFKSDDSRNPELTFFTTRQSNESVLPGGLVNINGRTDIVANDSIGVYIDEYVSLGFDHYIKWDALNARYTLDANAMRRYFKVFDYDSVAMQFDVVGPVTVLNEASGDRVMFFIDPYYVNADGTPKANTEGSNFTKCKKYWVYFNSIDADDNGLEANWGKDKGVYWDSNHNLVLVKWANFTSQCDPAPSCVQAQIAPTPSANCLMASSMQYITVGFNSAANTPLPYITIREGISSVTTIAGELTPGNSNIVRYPVTGVFESDSSYSVALGVGTRWSTPLGGNISINSGVAADTWPAEDCDAPYGTDSVWTYKMVDETAPIFDTIGGAGHAWPAPYASYRIPQDESWGFDKRNDIVLIFSEAVQLVANKRFTIYDSNNDTKAIIYAQQCRYGKQAAPNQTKDDKRVIIIPHETFESSLNYLTNYHINTDIGIITDLSTCHPNNWAGIFEADLIASGGAPNGLNGWSFRTGSDPAPYFTTFSPANGTPVVTTLTIEFSEEVYSNSGQIVISEVTAGPVFTPVETFLVTNTNMIRKTSPKIWEIQGFAPVFGKQYAVTIPQSAFIDAAGQQLVVGCSTTGVLFDNTLPIEDQTVEGTATWYVNFRDAVAPYAINNWPRNNAMHVPYNAYIYIEFNESINLSDGSAIIPDPNLLLQNIDEFITLSRSGNSDVPYEIEFVGNNKRLVRITPLDPNGYNYNPTTGQPTMMTCYDYTVTLNPTAPPTYRLVDAANNQMTATLAFSFRTEDITAPVISAPTVAVDACTNKFNFHYDAVESCSDTLRLYYVVLPASAGTPTASSIFAQNTAGAVKMGVVGGKGTTGVNFTVDMGDWTENPSFKLYAVARDCEVDIWTPSSSAWDSLFFFAPSKGYGEGYDRIVDIMAAPNYNNTVVPTSSFMIWDNDVPTIKGSYPVVAQTQFPINDNIRFWFSEAVEKGLVAPDSITLRRFDNNIAIKAKVTWPSTGVHADSTFIIDPVSPLEQETKYYVEFDRYAIRDSVNVCASNSVYYPQMVGRGFWFVTQDNRAPRIKDHSPTENETCVSCPDLNADGTDYITINYYDANEVQANLTAGDPFIYLYRVNDVITPRVAWNVIPVSQVTVTKDALIDTVWHVTIPVRHQYYPNDLIEVVVPDDVIKDVWGNKSAGHSWRYTTCNTESPKVQWTVENLSAHFNYSAELDEAGIFGKWDLNYRKGTQGDPNANPNNMPTHIALKLDFGEEVAFNTAGTTWEPLSTFDYDGTNSTSVLVPSELMSILKMGNLKYNTTYATSDYDSIIVAGNTVTLLFKYGTNAKLPIYKLLAEADSIDGSGLPYLEDYYMASLESNKSYPVTVTANKVRAINNCLENQAPRYVQPDIVTIQTRDDTPPTVDFKNAAGQSICETNVCIGKREPITISFSDSIVKSSYDVQWLGEESYTFDNLPLKKDDLRYPIGGVYSHYFELCRVTKNSNGTFTRMNTSAKDTIAIDNVTLGSDLMNYVVSSNTDFVSEGWYELVFKKFTVKKYIDSDPSGTVYEGGDTCRFFVGDYIAPTVSWIAPYNGETNVGSDTKELKVVLNENVVLGPSSVGKTVIRRQNSVDGASIYAEFTTAQTTLINKNKTDGRDTIIFNVGKLENFTRYYVEMPKGFIVDDNTICDANQFAGFAAKLGSDGLLQTADWTFMTSDSTPPELMPVTQGSTVRSEDALFPKVGSTVATNSDLVMIFDENIVITNTIFRGITIYHDNGDPGSFGNAVEFIPWSNFYSPFADKKISISGSNEYDGLTANVITINPATIFDKKGVYYVRVNGIDITDGNGNNWSESVNAQLDPVKDREWYFSIVNDAAPVLVATTPSYDGVNNARTYNSIPADPHGFVKTDLSMTFMDALVGGSPIDVAPGGTTRKIRIFEYTYDAASAQFKAKPWLEIPVNDASRVEFVGNVVTLKNVILRDGINGNGSTIATDSCYYVTVDPGAIVNGLDAAQTWWQGINNGFVWRFTTGDDVTFVAEPQIISPLNDAVDLTIDEANNLIVDFGEGIEKLANPAGKVQVFKVGVTAPVEEVTVTQAMISGKRLNVPLTNIVDETSYYVQIQAGAFGDTSTVSTPNTAFGGEDVWGFQTGDNTAPKAVTKSPSAGCVEAATALIMTFNESRGVTKGTGTLEVKDPKGTIVAQVAAEDITISEDGNTVTAMVEGLPDTTLLTVTVPAGFIFDKGNNVLPNAIDSWTFTTGENTVPTVVITPNEVGTPDAVLTLTFSEVVASVGGKNVTINDVAVDADSLESVDGKVYTLPLTGLSSETTYTVVVEEGAFIDVNAGCVPNVVAKTTDTFVVGDIIAPVATGSPKTAADYVGLKLDINFSEAVTPATGNIVIMDAATDLPVETISVTSSALTASVDKTVYSFAPTKVKFGQYYILIDAGAFVDLGAAPIAQACPGISSKTVWPLSIVDPSFDGCIVITSMKPARAEQKVPTTTTVVITFCTERLAPGVGVITIADQSVNRVLGVNYFEYPVTDDMISGSTLTIPVTGLKESTTYSIIIPYGAITDEAGNPFIGITDANSWIFTTGDFTDPVVSVATATVMNDGTGAPIAITSSEAGVVYLAKDDVPATAAGLLAAIAQNKAVAATLAAPGSVNVSAEGLVVGTYKAYGFDASGRMGTAANVVTVTTIVPIPYSTIKAIQGQAAASPMAGQKVRTKGVVTVKLATGFYMQDANAEWGGIFVAYTGTVSENSSVEVIGTVSEVDGLTTIGAVEGLTFIAPVIEVKALNLAPNKVVAEANEGVLVTVTGRAAASGSAADWTISSTASSIYAINNAYYGAYSYKQDYKYAVTGIGIPAAANYKVLATEIVDLSTTNGIEDLSSSIKVYPNPFNEFITLSVSNSVVITKAVITNIAGQLVKEVINPNNTIPTSELRSGVYFISLHTVDGIAKTERIIKR